MCDVVLTHPPPPFPVFFFLSVPRLICNFDRRGVRFANPDSDDDEAAPIPSDVVDDTG